MKNKAIKDENKIIEICCHNISYYYDNGMEMPGSDIEHVQERIVDGCNQGELNALIRKGKDMEEMRGWWSIERD